MKICFLLALCAACASTAHAQAQASPVTPSADQMIEQLRSPRTRSLRNLQVEAVQPAASSAGALTASAPLSPAPSAPGLPQAALATEPPVSPAAPPQTFSAAPASLSLLIQFDFDSARVRPESLQALANLAAALKSEDLKRARFAIEGHTDGKGRAEYNQRLSQIRADAVAGHLVRQGIARERLQPLGKGANDLANLADPSAAENRRVRIINLD